MAVRGLRGVMRLGSLRLASEADAPNPFAGRPESGGYGSAAATGVLAESRAGGGIDGAAAGFAAVAGWRGGGETDGAAACGREAAAAGAVAPCGRGDAAAAVPVAVTVSGRPDGKAAVAALLDRGAAGLACSASLSWSARIAVGERGAADFAGVPGAAGAALAAALGGFVGGVPGLSAPRAAAGCGAGAACLPFSGGGFASVTAAFHSYGLHHQVSEHAPLGESGQVRIVPLSAHGC